MGSIDHLFDDQAVIARRPKDLIGGGRVRELPCVPIATRPFRSPAPLGFRDRTNASREEADATNVTYTAADTDVRRGDELTFQKQPGRNFLVKATQRPSVTDHHLKVTLQELQRDQDAV